MSTDTRLLIPSSRARRRRYALADYLALCKPASVALLVFVGLATFLVAAGGPSPAWPLAVVLLAGATGSAGANAASCYFDRDLDAAMRRTHRRPLPGDRIRPPERALQLGLALMATALALSATLGPLAFGLMLVGQLDYVLVYCLLAKRRTRWNVVWGSISGAVPVLFAWAAATGTLSLHALLMATLVVLWIPTHIWTLALYHVEDYRRANVPMLPAVSSWRQVSVGLGVAAILTVVMSLALVPVGGYGWGYGATAAGTGLALLVGNAYLARRRSRSAARLLFKLSSPYLLVIFAALALSATG